MNLLSVLLPFGILLLSMLPALYWILRRKDRGPRAMPEGITYHEKLELFPRAEHARGAGKLPSEALEQVLKEAEDLLREAGDLLGEDDDH